jgi:two-component system sensor histidine kinase QseC
MLSSLRIRILLTIIGVIVPVMLIYSITGFQHVSDELTRRFDGRMTREMRMLETAVARSGGDIGRIAEMIEVMPTDSFPRRRHLSIWSGDRLIVASENLPFTAPPPATPGFHAVSASDSDYRVLSAVLQPTAATHDQTWVLSVAEFVPMRTGLIRQAARDILYPLAVAIPLVVIGVYVALLVNLRSLTNLASQIRRRSADRLQPIDTTGVPNEMQPIATSVNHLMSRLGESLDRERRFTADAAHELRTPLTALKAHAQVALKAEDEHLRRDALRSIARTVNRTDRMISQLLTLARLDPDAGPTYLDKVDLGRVASRTLSELRGLAETRGQHLNLHADGSVVVRGNSDALSILMRNIVENAIQYSEDGTPIDIRVFGDGANGVLEVNDHGPGIPDEEKQEVFGRFRRLPGTKGSGIGLGLSIVQRIADLHGGRIALFDADAGPGLKVTATIPAAVD